MYIEALAKLGISAAHPGGLPLTKELFKNEKLNQATSILDIGCGTGATAEYLYEEYQCQINACDIHPIMINKANLRFEESHIPLKAMNANAECLPFSNEIFDYVISESVLVFTNINKSLAEFYRVLKPGGKLIAIEMCRDQSVNESELTKFKKFYQVEKLLSLKGWEKTLEEKHFSTMEAREYRIEMDNSEGMFVIEPSSDIDDHVYDIFLEHLELLQQYYQKVFPCIIRAIKTK